MKNMIADNVLDLTAFSQPKLGASILKSETSFSIKNNSIWHQKANLATAQRSHLENIFQKNALQNMDSEPLVEDTIIRMTESGKNLMEEEKTEARLIKSPVQDRAHGSVRKNSVSRSIAKDSNCKIPQTDMCIEEPFNFNQARRELHRSDSQEEQIEQSQPRSEKNLGWETGNTGAHANKMKIEEEGPRDKKEAGPMELIIQPVDGVQTNNFYCLNEAGGRIGRHSNNEIVILEESVSRHHSKIEFNQDKFYLIDIGSTTGTFIKIQAKLELEEGQILELGSNQFFVEEINCIDRTEGELKLKIIEGLHLNKEFYIQNSATIGRKASHPNSIAFTDDLHLSNNHAKIEYIEGRFVFEDMGSTNG